jgi:prolyl-tRNA editing enzyme YbaK/EbsC (Cys-tRNA(Pro) deacylase)
VAVQPRRRPSASQLCVRSLSAAADTRAVAVLAEAGVAYSLASVVFEKRDGESLSASFARQCGVTPNDVIKTMVFKAGAAAPPCIVLMNGDRTVCAKKLAALVGIGVKQVKPADPETAERHTGYQFGGTYSQKSAL